MHQTETRRSERTPLLYENSTAQDASETSPTGVPSTQSEETDTVETKIKQRLYTSHFLSTWNSRMFEFGAILYLATIYPGTLLPMSIYAFVRGLAAILFAPAVGQYIDRANRLKVARLSIVLQRAAVSGSCCIFYVLASRLRLSDAARAGLLTVLAFLACIEKLCAIMNLVAIERDWVVVIAASNQKSLRNLNAEMRRIDLVCKLLGPLFIALVDGISTEVAIIVNFAMNTASMIIEYYAIVLVYRDVPGLQETKVQSLDRSTPLDDSRDHQRYNLQHNWTHVRDTAARSLADFRLYFRHRAFLPSFSGALLYFTVLSFAGQMVTYLTSTGYSSSGIGVARTLAVAFEVAATWVAPWVVSRIGPTRTGLWGLNWQMLCLGIGVLLFFIKANDQPMVSASALVVGTIISRLGLRAFDLSAQLIIQEEVEQEVRGSFSSVESAWQNGFELCSYLSTIVFSRPDQFRWPALVSVIAVYTAGALFAASVRKRRGHLLHGQRLGSCVCFRTRKEQDESDRQCPSPALFP